MWGARLDEYERTNLSGIDTLVQEPAMLNGFLALLSFIIMAFPVKHSVAIDSKLAVLSQDSPES